MRLCKAVGGVLAFSLAALLAYRQLKPNDGTVLLSDAAARQQLNQTRLHREWVRTPDANGFVKAFVVYPDRADKAPVVMVTEAGYQVTHPIRELALRLAGEGYLAVVPDVLSGKGPNGGDADSFADPEAAADAIAALGKNGAEQRMAAMEAYALQTPAAGSTVSRLNILDGGAQVDSGDAALAGSNWAQTVAFLNRQTDNHPISGSALIAEDHSAHFGMIMAQTPPKSTGLPPGYPFEKLRYLPAGLFTAKTTLANSKLRKEFVDIPLNPGTLHTWIEYPEGNAKAPVILVMQQGPGLDDWMRSVADQLAQEGFIAVAPDMYSGMGPNGGNFDSFFGPDDALRALGKVTTSETMRRYKAAYAYASKIPRASGKLATLGFCIGGNHSFQFAGEMPQISAAVVYYGTQPDEATMAKIKAPVLGFYGENDERVTASVQPTIAAMKKLGKSYEPHIYPRATHAFLDFQELGGNPQATADSWPRTIDFLKKHTR